MCLILLKQYYTWKIFDRNNYNSSPFLNFFISKLVHGFFGIATHMYTVQLLRHSHS